MRQQLLKKICPIVLLIIVFITALSCSIIYVHAGNSFASNSDAWSGIQNSLSAKESDTYPYNEPSAKVTSVPLDILYGATKGFGLATYHGEVPYEQVYDDDDTKADGFGGLYARPGTTIANGTDNNPGDVSAKTYWGFDDTTSINIDGSSTTISGDKKSAKLSQYEKINDSEIISLRLHALANTNGGFFGAIGTFFSNLLYMVGVGLASLATMLLSLIISAKNIDIDAIMKMLNLQSLADIMTKNFIFNSDNLALSPFMLFAIIMFIFAIVVFVVKYVRGQDRTTGLKDLLLTAVLGLLVIGMCLTNNITTLGSSAADLANQLMTAVAGVSSSSGSGNVFAVSISDKKNTNKISQISEMSMVNKIFIDMQLCAQFGVSNINELNVENLGDTNATIANDILMDYVDSSTSSTAPNMNSEFGNNIGYYFWFADSSASKKTALNAEFPSTNSNVIEDKLETMITYLQAVYNDNIAKGNTAENDAIRRIIESLARPNGASGCLALLLLTAILVVMGICLFKYCLNVVIAKLELFLSILGLAVAGPLMLTTNKKLVNTGKAIIGMLPVAFIEITVYSIVFDLIIFLVASLMSTNILQLLVVLFLILLLMKFNPLLQEKIKQLINNSTRAISPVLSDTKRAIKSYTRQKANNIINNYDKSKKVVGYDKDGNEITQERGGNALSKLMHQGYNTIYNDGTQREGFSKINRKQDEIRARSVNKSAEELRRDAENSINDVLENVDKDASALITAFAVAMAEYQDKYYTVNGNDIIYCKDNLSDEDAAKATEIDNIKTEAEAIKNSSTYRKLMAEKNHIDAENNAHKNEEGYEIKQMDAVKLQKLESLTNQANEKLRSAEQLNALLKQTIDSRATDFAYDKLGLDKNVEGENSEQKNATAIMLKAQEAHRDELQKALQNGLNTIKDEVNTLQSTKIGSSSSTVNRAAVASSAAMMHQMNQLNNGKIVSNISEAKNDTKDVVDNIVQYNDAHVKSNKIDNAKIGIKEAKQEVKDTHKVSKDNYKNAKQENGRTISSATISEQLSTAINNHAFDKSSTTNTLTKATSDKAVTTNAENLAKDTSMNSKTANVTTATEDRWAKVEEADKAEAANAIKQPKLQPQPAKTLTSLVKNKETVNTTNATNATNATSATNSVQSVQEQTQSTQPTDNSVSLQKQVTQAQIQQNKVESQPQQPSQTSVKLQPQQQSQTQAQTQVKPQPQAQVKSQPQSSQPQTQTQTQTQTHVQTKPQAQSQPTVQQPNSQSVQTVQPNQQTQPQVQQSVQNIKLNSQPTVVQNTQVKPNIQSNISTQKVEQVTQNVQTSQKVDNVKPTNISIHEAIQKHESNTVQPQVERPVTNSQPIQQPAQQIKVNIESVKPTKRDKSEYIKDEGREYLANEEANKVNGKLGSSKRHK